MKMVKFDPPIEMPAEYAKYLKVGDLASTEKDKRKYKLDDYDIFLIQSKTNLWKEEGKIFLHERPDVNCEYARVDDLSVGSVFVAPESFTDRGRVLTIKQKNKIMLNFLESPLFIYLSVSGHREALVLYRPDEVKGFISDELKERIRNPQAYQDYVTNKPEERDSDIEPEQKDWTQQERAKAFQNWGQGKKFAPFVEEIEPRHRSGDVECESTETEIVERECENKLEGTRWLVPTEGALTEFLKTIEGIPEDMRVEYHTSIMLRSKEFIGPCDKMKEIRIVRRLDGQGWKVKGM